VCSRPSTATRAEAIDRGLEETQALAESLHHAEGGELKPAVLVTGAAGFVGQYLMRRLLGEGYALYAIDKDEGPNCFKMSFEDFLKDYRSKMPYDVVVHLAANIRNVNYRVRQGISAHEDILLDYQFCQWCQENWPGHVVLMSSCATDGIIDPYSAVKRNLESMANTLVRRGLTVTILRPFSGYGGDQSLEYPFSAILDRALKKENPLTVWGGGQVRDWLYIDDLIDAIMFAIEGKFFSGQAIDIGTGIGVSFYDLANMIADVVGYAPKIFGDTTKEQSTMVRVANVTAAQQCGWFAKVPLREGIKKSLQSKIRFSNPVQ
jgi:nucleoside-diphosphate-sugar epimerase